MWADRKYVIYLLLYKPIKFYLHKFNVNHNYVIFYP